jgi:A/G-specific adenine glycosylase
MTLASFASRVVEWQQREGRSGLPWQQSADPYRVWLSEIMLQQTQVATVLRYYPRFLARFPDVQSLAEAPIDEVLGLWSGLGYYSRARSLHRCAQVVCAVHGGRFPTCAAELERLPGIGRSTAAAIASFCFHEPVSILDGNVRRLLTRHLGFDADLSKARNVDALWQRAQMLVPIEEPTSMPRYTQGLMDLGAMICTPRRPRCAACPLAGDCRAYASGEPERLPTRRLALARQSRQLWLLWLERPDGATLLQRRPARGIWGGLHCLPAFDSLDALRDAAHRGWGLTGAGQTESPRVHRLTHLDLTLQPVRWCLDPPGAPQFLDGADWYLPAQWERLGLPAPIRVWLQDSARSRSVDLAMPHERRPAAAIP